MSCVDEETVHKVQYDGTIDIGKLAIGDGPPSRDLGEILVDAVERMLLTDPSDAKSDVEINVSKRGLRIMAAEDGRVLERFALHKIAHILAYYSGIATVHHSIILIHCANDSYKCCLMHSDEPDEISKICEQLHMIFSDIRSEVIHNRRVMRKDN